MNSLITSYSGSSNPSNKKVIITSNPFPGGMSISDDGTFSGKPFEFGNWTLKFYVTDFNNISTYKNIDFNVNESTSNLNNQSDEFILFPNPTYGKINIQTNEKIENIKVFDIKGKFIINFSENTVDLSNQESGIYFLQIQTDKGLYNRKIILKK
jgi:hypothetical protein